MKKVERFVVVPYALVDVIHALHCNGITEITVTKEDDNLIVVYDYTQIYNHIDLKNTNNNLKVPKFETEE